MKGCHLHISTRQKAQGSSPDPFLRLRSSLKVVLLGFLQNKGTPLLLFFFPFGGYSLWSVLKAKAPHPVIFFWGGQRGNLLAQVQ